jgi:hypothetical protein
MYIHFHHTENHENISKDLQIMRRKSTFLSQNKEYENPKNSVNSLYLFQDWDLIYGNLNGHRSINDFDIFRDKLVVYGRSEVLLHVIFFLVMNIFF